MHLGESKVKKERGRTCSIYEGKNRKPWDKAVRFSSTKFISKFIS